MTFDVQNEIDSFIMNDIPISRPYGFNMQAVLKTEITKLSAEE